MKKVKNNWLKPGKKTRITDLTQDKKTRIADINQEKSRHYLLKPGKAGITVLNQRKADILT